MTHSARGGERRVGLSSLSSSQAADQFKYYHWQVQTNVGEETKLTGGRDHGNGVNGKAAGEGTNADRTAATPPSSSPPLVDETCDGVIDLGRTGMATI